MTNIEVWLWILLVMLPHNPRTPELLSRYRTALDAAIAMRDGRCDLLTEAEMQRVERTRTRDVKALIAQCEHLGIRIIALDSPEYPLQLKRIDNPPIVLFVKGDITPLNSHPAIAVVGPRVPSEYGAEVTDKLCSELCRDGAAVVSGLAVGIDAASHRSTVRQGGYTVGVLGCGLEADYPPENAGLKKEIVAGGGAMISELLPYTAARAPYFVLRNRIIAGLSVASVVIEASAKSGSLATAGITRAQGKPVFCVPPHDIYSISFRGTVNLLKDYALPLYGVSDIYDELSRRSNNGEHIPHAKQLKRRENTGAVTSSKPRSKSKPQAFVEVPLQTAEIDLSQYSTQEAEIISLLREKPLSMDEIIDRSGKGYDEICSILLGLELNDVLTRQQDGFYSLLGNN